MARRSSRSRSTGARSRRSTSHPPASTHPPAGTTIEPPGEFTGRYLVLLRDNGVSEGLQALKSNAGLTEVCNAADFRAGEVEMSQADDAEVFILDKLKVAVVRADPSQVQSLTAAAAEDSAIMAVEPERIMYALQALQPAEVSQPGTPPLQYLRGYKDAVNHLYETFAGTAPELAEVGIAAAFSDNAQFTWGLQATKVNQSRFTGRGVRIAVLDTGMDTSHPDFVGRTINSLSFVPGEQVQDRNGHGTHCIGTALGPKAPATGVRRYGCASTGNVFAGKVLSNGGSGSDSGILAGINWAIANQCRIVSMSLGAMVRPGESFSPIYEAVAERALAARPGTLIIAAAGNDSAPTPGQRLEPPVPVSRPANCPSIMAVAAIDSSLRIAPFSNGGINLGGGGVDIAAPGVNVFSSLPTNRGTHGSLSGTSMATPHVAGIAAMWLEARGSSTTAQVLWQLLTGNALRLPIASKDVGAGLVQAPIHGSNGVS